MGRYYIVKAENEVLVLKSGEYSQEMSTGVLISISRVKSTAIADLDVLGLRIVNDYLKDYLQEVDITSYNLNIYSVKFRGLTLKSSRQFGLNGGDLKFSDLILLNNFINKYSGSSLSDDRIISLSSLSNMIAKISGKVPKLKLENSVNQFIEKSYFGGRCELFLSGKHKNVKWFDYPSAYGNMLLLELPISYSKGTNIDKPGFYEIEFSNGSKIAKLPVELSSWPVRSVMYSESGAGVFWHEEILSFIRCGGLVTKVKSGLEVREKEAYLKGLAESMMAARSSGSKFAKIVLNSAYGNLAMKISKSKDKVNDFESSRSDHFESLRCISYKDLTIVNRGLQNREPGRNYNVGAASMISSKVRANIMSLMAEVENCGGSVIYLDTDCIAYTGDYDVKGSKLMKEVDFISKKNYNAG